MCVSYALIWYCECFKKKVYINDHGIKASKAYFLYLCDDVYINENMKYKYWLLYIYQKNPKTSCLYLLNKKMIISEKDFSIFFSNKD